MIEGFALGCEGATRDFRNNHGELYGAVWLRFRVKSLALPTNAHTQMDRTEPKRTAHGDTRVCV